MKCPEMVGDQPKIEIFAPFGAAYEWMKSVLFRPFDVMKWLTIAFAAFIGGSWGGGLNLRLGRFWKGNWNYRVTRNGDLPVDWNIPGWLIAFLIAGGLIILILMLVWMWVSSRGRFIFTDCVVKNRAAIADPWREFRREGNSYFLFSLAVGVVMVALTLVFIVAAGLGFWSHREGTFALILVASIVLAFIWLILVIFVALISHFMVPVMYRRRCPARAAFLDVARLIFSHPGPFVLFVLFGIVLTLAVATAGMTVACLTCCIGGLPYISTVLLLPAIIWLAAFKLLFLRQFGEQYDVWGAVGLPQTEPDVPEPPGPPAAPPSPA